ncbi:hypothetical protein [Solicola gregarius]|uniref:Uncharacterized protein n=1 Tax=Solicola gregarius TaxID=2908642 RepID=A0AA46YKP2_9ACTN|nr:hypothetical protein [Solicola gregarius]UYM04799.1 hypothetical protein L0C25_20050 [Solicola gregarius]
MSHALTVLLAVATTATSVVLTPSAEAVEATDDRQATTVRIHPGTLAKGAPTSQARLVGTTIRDGRFRKRVRVLKPYPHVWIHGKARKGYIVGGDRKGYRARLWYVPRKGYAKRLQFGERDAYWISPSGRHASVVRSGRRRDRLSIRTIPGDKTISRWTARRIDVLDMRGARALVDVSARGREWVSWLRPKPDSMSTVVRRAGWWASARHNRLLTDEPAAKGGFAMVRLDKPTEVIWRRGMRGLAPRSISPDGRYLQSDIWRWRDGVPTKLVGIELRRMSDGRVVRRFRAKRLGWSSAWTGPHTFVVAAAGRSRTSMVRCRAGGRCVRFGRLVRTRHGVSPDVTLGVDLATGRTVASRTFGPRDRARGVPLTATS